MDCILRVLHIVVCQLDLDIESDPFVGVKGHVVCFDCQVVIAQRGGVLQVVCHSWVSGGFILCQFVFPHNCVLFRATEIRARVRGRSVVAKVGKVPLHR